MNCFISQSNNPYFNLASEEYFLKNKNEEYFLLYINEPSVVAGKHQNILAEINQSWVRKNNILPARRISGGGTVYHDQGNLNFSFISDCPDLENVSYKRLTLPIILALNSIGVTAEFSGHNDIILENRKISGNAMHIYKNRVLSHGTLLYESDLNHLSNALKNHKERYIDKSIKSIPSRVVNISEFLNPPMSMNDFTDALFAETFKHLGSTRIYSLSNSDINEIEKLAREKFSTWDWIYGYSPKYIFQNEIELYGQSVKFQLNVEKGWVKSYSLEKDINADKNIVRLFDSLVNVKHDYQSFLEIFSKHSLTNLNSDFSINGFCDQFF